MKRLAGANHIIQRIYFRDLPGAQLGSFQEKDQVQQDQSLADIAKSFDQQANMFAMEYMRNGDVRDLIALINASLLPPTIFANSKNQIYHLLIKIGGLGGLIKDQDLWEVFHCCRFLTRS